jgi:hypothetical protein
MDNKTLQLEVSSPAELQEALTAHVQNGALYASVRVFGPNILTRQFSFPQSSTNDLIAGLKHEASEALILADSDVELSYQVTGSDEQGLRGVISAMPRQLLMEYLQCFKDHPLIPVSLTTSAVGAVADFIKDKSLPVDNFCLVNFLKPGAVNIIVFDHANPIFFRELYDLSDSEYKDKISDTIRYSCGQSISKRVDHIFFVGDLTGKDDLVKSLKELQNTSPAQSVSPEGAKHIDLTGLNLFGKHVCGLAELSKLASIFTALSVISLLLGMFLTWHFANGYTKLQAVKARVNISDYNLALKLQDQVRRLNHGQ